jgi:hypothetical protein
MSALSIQVPFPVFQDRDGQPLDNGYVWIGVANLNPQTNPVVAYYDAALTIQAVQPLRTINGYISNAGTPAQIYVDANDFSILVLDSKGTTVYSFPSGTGISPTAAGIEFTGFKGQVGNIENLAGDDGSDWIGFQPAAVTSIARSAQDKIRETVSVADFGAVGDGITDDTVAIQAAIDSIARGTLLFPQGTYKTTATINIAGKNSQNDPTQSSLEILAYGAKIESTVGGSTAALYINGCKRLIINGLEVSAASSTLTVQVQGLWNSTWDSCFFGNVQFSGLGSSFDSHYWNKFVNCQFGEITINTGTKAARSEFNANTFDTCRIWYGEYAIKKYGAQDIQDIVFINCDISYQSIAILYVDETTTGNLSFFGGYFDSSTGFPADTKGIALDFNGSITNPNSANLDNFVVDTASKSESKGAIGVRTGGRIPTSGFNLIKNGNLSLGALNIGLNDVTATMVAGDGLFGKYVNLTGNLAFRSFSFSSIPVPFAGTYTLTVIGRNTSGVTVNSCNGFFGVIDLAPTFAISSFTTVATQGSVLTWLVQNSSAGGVFSFDIAYVGLTYGSSAPIYAPTIPLIGSATYDPPSLADGAGTTTTVTCTGATVGMFARASFGVDLQGITLSAWVSSANTVSVRFQNESGGSLDLASSTLTVKAEW